MGLTRTQAFPWAAKYPDFNRPFCGGPERPHLCNPVLSSTVVAQEPVEDVLAAGVQPESGSSPSVVRELESTYMPCILEEDWGVREEDSGRRSICSLSRPPTPPWEPGHTSNAKVVLLNDHSVPK